MNIDHTEFHQLNVHELHCCVAFLPMRLVRVRWGWCFNELFNPLGVHFGYGVMWNSKLKASLMGHVYQSTICWAISSFPVDFWEAVELPLSFIAFCYLFQRCLLWFLSCCSILVLFFFYSFIEVLLIASEVTSLKCTAWRMFIFPL